MAVILRLKATGSRCIIIAFELAWHAGAVSEEHAVLRRQGDTKLQEYQTLKGHQAFGDGCIMTCKARFPLWI